MGFQRKVYLCFMLFVHLLANPCVNNKKYYVHCADKFRNRLAKLIRTLNLFIGKYDGFVLKFHVSQRVQA